MWFYGPFLLLALLGSWVALAIDFCFWLAIARFLRPVFDLSMCFKSESLPPGSTSENRFFTVSRTQRIEFSGTDLSTYALAAAIEDKQEVKVMLYKVTFATALPLPLPPPSRL